MRFGRRQVTRDMVLGAVDSFTVIEPYPDDKYLPYLLRDPVMAEIERLLGSADHAAELAVLRYAA